MSVTTGGDQGQGNGNRNANQITQSSQEVVVNTGGVTTAGARQREHSSKQSSDGWSSQTAKFQSTSAIIVERELVSNKTTKFIYKKPLCFTQIFDNFKL
mmetsp:Transcript_3985/g.5915  ORF Transcript_3985/g.5915 Transcript_3985/m.5915 type:complete len:99 (+) Transcript_3985:139-435(+)